MKQFIISLLLLIPSLAMAEKTYTCSIHVRDLISSEPLKGILVTFTSEDEYFEATTNSDGSVIFSGLHSKEGILKFADSKNIYASDEMLVFNRKRRDNSFDKMLHEPYVRKPLAFYYDRNKLYPPPKDKLDRTTLTDTIHCDSTQNRSAEFAHGPAAMKRFIQKFVDYPSEAREF